MIHRAAKVKALTTRVPVRKAALSGSSSTRRNFPAWIDASEGVAAFPARVTPRVRDGLVLRALVKSKSEQPENRAHGPSGR